VYTAAFRGVSGPYFDALQKYDLATGAVQTRPCADGEFPSEVAFVPVADKDAPEDAGCALASRSSALVCRQDARLHV
jgi:carotenoid cleavage dioxygenase-like enzyme